MIRQLNINNYEVHFILGNDSNEKSQQRRVILNIKIRLLEDSEACKSDKLDETICYCALLNFIEKSLENANFNLIERVAQYIYDITTEYLKNNKVAIFVEVIKPKPLNENLESSSFICSDW